MKEYTLPDGRTIKVGAERFMAPEVMFKPSLIDEADGVGLHEQIFNCIQEMDIDNRMDMYAIDTHTLAHMNTPTHAQSL